MHNCFCSLRRGDGPVEDTSRLLLGFHGSQSSELNRAVGMRCIGMWRVCWVVWTMIRVPCGCALALASLVSGRVARVRHTWIVLY